MRGGIVAAKHLFPRRDFKMGESDDLQNLAYLRRSFSGVFCGLRLGTAPRI